MADTAILDVDGTLVDTNYQHALASSGKARHVEHFIDLLGGRDLAADLDDTPFADLG